MTDFIRKKFDVEDPDKTTTIRMDEKPPRPGGEGDAIFLIGLSGCGKSAVATRLAQELSGHAAELPLEDPDGVLSTILAAPGGPAVIAVPHKLLTIEPLRQRIRAAGRVLYLMTDVSILAERLAASPEETEAQRKHLGHQRTAFEPLFMQSLHLLVPADGPLDAVVADALERLRQ